MSTKKPVIKHPHKNWREEVQADLVPIKNLEDGKIRFDDDAKQRFLECYAEFGRKTLAAKAADVSIRTVRNHIESDPDFALAVEDAKLMYRDEVRAAVHLLGVEGVRNPIFGGQYKTEKVGEKREFAPQVTLAEARRVDEGYRDKGQLDVNLTAGVLVVPATMSVEEWQEKYGKKPDEPKQLTDEKSGMGPAAG